MKPADVHPDLWATQNRRGKALMLFYRAWFIPSRLRWWVFVWRVNRTPGKRWSYR